MSWTNRSNLLTALLVVSVSSATLGQTLVSVPVDAGTRAWVGVRYADDSTEVYVVSEQAQVLRTSLSEISSMGRTTQGVTIFKPQPGDAVASIACVKALDIPDDTVETPAKSNGKKPVTDIS